MAAFQKILPSGRPDEAATAAYLRQREADGLLGQHGRFLLDSSQIQAIATAVMNPLVAGSRTTRHRCCSDLTLHSQCDATKLATLPTRIVFPHTVGLCGIVGKVGVPAHGGQRVSMTFMA